jgi:chromosome segregation ATPase
MAEKFSRSWLEELGIEPDVVKQIMARHVGVTDALKEQIADSEAQADELSKVQDELKKLKASQKEQAEKLSAVEKERDEIKGKYDTAAADLDKIKAENAERETDEKCRKALADFLHEQKYSDFAVKNITRNGFHKSVKFGEDGKPKNLDEILKTIQADEDFSGFTPKTTEKSHTPATPPANTGGEKKMTKEEIMAITNTAERQQKIAENPTLFGMPVVSST